MADISLQSLDLSKVSFPSDQLGIADLKRMYPADFVLNDISGHFEESCAEHLLALVRLERHFVARTYANAKHQWRPTEHDFDDGEVEDALVEDYIAFGLASGPAHAHQILRTLAASALKQVETQGPQR